MKLTEETFGTFDDFIKWVHGFEELEKENKQLTKDNELLNSELKIYFKEALKNKQKLEKIKELSKVFQREGWGDCRYIRKIICEKLNEILDSQEKD